MRSTLTINVAQILNSADNYVPTPFSDGNLILGRGRRQAEKQKQREEKSQQEATKKDYRKAWLELKDQTYPTRPDEMEQFFLSQISQAETLIAQGMNAPMMRFSDIGPSMYISAAQHFYRALKVYPNTVELLDIYQKTVPESAYNTIMGIREAEEADTSNPENSMD